MITCPALALALSTVVGFAEPDFPAPAGVELAPLPGAELATDTDELVHLLADADVLVWRHGPYFPSEAWPDFIAFLERGGSLLVLGTEPFTRPVVGAPGARVVQPRTVSLLKELRLNQSHALDASGARLEYPRVHGVGPATLPDGATVSVLEPRFGDTRDFEDEDGAPSARDALLRPLGFLHREGDDPRFPFATASFAIERLLGRFAGGRWVFRLTDAPLTQRELDHLLAEARRPALDFRVDPTFGCFHEGERPSVLVRAHRPLAGDVVERTVGLVVTRPDGTQLRTEHALEFGRHTSRRIPLEGCEASGLYRVVAFSEDWPPHETGFWVMDEELFTSGDELAMGPWALERNGVPEPVIGTTVMSPSVHRDFLFEPNAAEWDDTFGTLASIDVNLVRTGVWSGFKKLSLDANVVDEAFLRALEAYYLSARRHGIPVVFTFFTFVPEAFGGVSPYFDPRSIAGQRAYLASVVERFRDAKEILWDLVNEPSFANPDKLWTCRPNGDRYEQAAFVSWLEERYSGSPDGRTWQDVVRARWRLLPDEPIGVPTEADYAERQVMEAHRPYRAKEYAHFAQDAFADWAREMRAAIRQAGSDAPITVGQDEGGLFERPGPLTHADVVEFTSIHTWWFNDALVWDAWMAKAPGKPLLVSESGIMNRELLSGEALRSPEDSARLLARKLASSFAGGAFGMVQWCWDVNPYMASDNEVAIGIRRVDGSYKPELGVIREFAGFFARSRGSFDDYVEPDVALVFPSSDHYGPRSFQAAGTQRLVARLLAAGTRVQVVPEHRAAGALDGFDTILLPSCRGIADEAWEAILTAVEQGATLFASGWFETDDAGLPARRLGAPRRPLATVELAKPTRRGGRATWTFERDVAESWFRADWPDRTASLEGSVRRLPHGDGVIVHHELPVDWATGGAPWPPGLTATRTALLELELPFASTILEVAINSSGTPLPETPPVLAAGEARLSLRAAGASDEGGSRDAGER